MSLTAPETQKDIRRLQILSSRLVTSIFAGEYRSVFRGRGIEFEEVREYHPGDDVRSIDWNVTARTGIPHVKRFVEEREMTVLLLLDRSKSMGCASSQGSKSLVAAEVCALLAFAATRSNDRLGLITFSDQIDGFVPPAKGSRHAKRIIAGIMDGEPRGNGSNLAVALDYLDRVTRCRAIIFIVSDFLTSDFHIHLAASTRRHDVVAVAVTALTDSHLPDVGLLQVADAETGTRRLIDTGSPAVRQTYESLAAVRRTELIRTLAATGVDYLELGTGTPPAHALARFFKGRQRRLRH